MSWAGLAYPCRKWKHPYRGADKSLARPGKKEAAPVKSVMGRGMD